MTMDQLKNLCAPVPLSLHTRVMEEKERTGQTLGQYITAVLTEYYETKGKGSNMEFTRTLAFQVPEELFQRLKAHLARESQRTGKRLSQKEFVLGLVERALDEAEAALAAEPDQGLQEAGEAAAPAPEAPEPDAPDLEASEETEE